MPTLALPFALALPAFLACQAQGPPAVTFTAPASWEDLGTTEQDGVLTTKYRVAQYTLDDGTRMAAIARIERRRAPVGLTLGDADRIAATRLGKAVLVLAGVDGEAWKTYLFHNLENGQPMTVFYRIGIRDGVLVEALLSYPQLGTRLDFLPMVLTLSPTAVKTAMVTGMRCYPPRIQAEVDTFNALCASLKIGGSNTFKVRFEFVAPDPDPVRSFPSN